jgi:hypothetical protein
LADPGPEPCDPCRGIEEQDEVLRTPVEVLGQVEAGWYFEIAVEAPGVRSVRFGDVKAEFLIYAAFAVADGESENPTLREALENEIGDV